MLLFSCRVVATLFWREDEGEEGDVGRVVVALPRRRRWKMAIVSAWMLQCGEQTTPLATGMDNPQRPAGIIFLDHLFSVRVFGGPSSRWNVDVIGGLGLEADVMTPACFWAAQCHVVWMVHVRADLAGKA